MEYTIWFSWIARGPGECSDSGTEIRQSALGFGSNCTNIVHPNKQMRRAKSRYCYWRSWASQNVIPMQIQCFSSSVAESHLEACLECLAGAD